ncbi:MAG: right-handed parallel beta-helix repeat-containing protein [Actinomycetota bacterium]
MAVVTGLIALVCVLLIALLPAGPSQEAPPAPQSASRYLRNETPTTLELGVSAQAALAAVAEVEPEEAAFLHTVDPQTFLTPFADSVLVDHPDWICDTPAPDDAIHVATDGDDANPGTAEEPLATITTAVNQAEPGQHVLVRGGRYEQEILISAVSGRPEAWITIRSYPGERATIATDIGQNAIAVRKGSSYLNIACFRLAGPTQQPEAIPDSASENRDRRLSGASFEQLPKNYGVGVDVGDRADTRNGLLSHHVRVIANEIHDFAEMGISAVEASHITVAGNVVYRNARYSCHAGSGIGIGYMLDAGGPDNSDGYSNYIVGNVSYENENRALQCFTDNLGAIITDGNGIIIDDNDSNDYQARTLVADNVVYNNGGRGILVFQSSRVDVVNNVTYHNAFTDNLMGRDGPHPEIAVARGDDVRIYNNIAVPRDGNEAYAENDSGADARANLFVDAGPATDLFASPTLDRTADFSVLEEAADRIAGGIPFLATVGPDGQPEVASPATIGTIYNEGLSP